MKNIKLQNIFFKKIAECNNYLINKFNRIKDLKNKFNQIIYFKNKFNQISNFNKFLIFFISTLFLYLFYVSTPSLYDYQRLQKQLKTHLLNNYNFDSINELYRPPQYGEIINEKHIGHPFSDKKMLDI